MTENNFKQIFESEIKSYRFGATPIAFIKNKHQGIDSWLSDENNAETIIEIITDRYFENENENENENEKKHPDLSHLRDIIYLFANKESELAWKHNKGKEYLFAKDGEKLNELFKLYQKEDLSSLIYVLKELNNTQEGKEYLFTNNRMHSFITKFAGNEMTFEKIYKIIDCCIELGNDDGINYLFGDNCKNLQNYIDMCKDEQCKSDKERYSLEYLTKSLTGTKDGIDYLFGENGHFVDLIKKTYVWNRNLEHLSFNIMNPVEELMEKETQDKEKNIRLLAKDTFIKWLNNDKNINEMINNLNFSDIKDLISRKEIMENINKEKILENIYKKCSIQYTEYFTKENFIKEFEQYNTEYFKIEELVKGWHEEIKEEFEYEANLEDFDRSIEEIEIKTTTPYLFFCQRNDTMTNSFTLMLTKEGEDKLKQNNININIENLDEKFKKYFNIYNDEKLEVIQNIKKNGFVEYIKNNYFSSHEDDFKIFEILDKHLELGKQQEFIIGK